MVGRGRASRKPTLSFRVLYAALLSPADLILFQRQCELRNSTHVAAWKVSGCPKEDQATFTAMSDAEDIIKRVIAMRKEVGDVHTSPQQQLAPSVPAMGDIMARSGTKVLASDSQANGDGPTSSSVKDYPNVSPDQDKAASAAAPEKPDETEKGDEREAAIRDLIRLLVRIDQGISNLDIRLGRLREENPYGYCSESSPAALTSAQVREVQDRFAVWTEPVSEAIREALKKCDGIALHISGLIDNPPMWETDLRTNLRLCGELISAARMTRPSQSQEERLLGFGLLLYQQGTRLQDAYKTVAASVAKRQQANRKGIGATRIGSGTAPVPKRTKHDMGRRQSRTSSSKTHRSETQRKPQLLAGLPELNTADGSWVRCTLAARLEGVETRTLAKYRSQGDATPDQMAGRDPQRRVWRRQGTPRAHPWYLKSSLTTQTKS